MSDLYFRVLLLIPENTTFDSLTLEQQEAIASVLGQYRMPMPGTVPFGGKVVCDALIASNFDPDTMDDYGLGAWQIIGQWDNTGAAITPLNEPEFILRLPLTELLTPPPLFEPHRWAGWPQLF